MKAKEIVDILLQEKLFFLTGVPCSFLKELLLYINDHKIKLQHIIATSEGEAVGIAAGYYLTTSNVPIVYMQNSGFGNAVNPLSSLMDREVYSIPLILFLTWRGELSIKDEPQHKKMGKIMLDLCKILEIPYAFASSNSKETINLLRQLKQKTIQEQRPVALIFRSDVIDKVDHKYELSLKFDHVSLKREEILNILLSKIDKNPIITTTGKTSREVFELREKFQQSHAFDFLTVGSMGCSAGIGFGIALQTKKKVFVIDGDGAVLMKMGTLATIGFYKPNNFTHIIIDNGAYESTGGQPTVSRTIFWKKMLKSVGYKNVKIIRTKQQLQRLELMGSHVLQGIVIYSQPGSRSDLGRPSLSPIENRNEFMKFLSN